MSKTNLSGYEPGFGPYVTSVDSAAERASWWRLRRRAHWVANVLCLVMFLVMVAGFVAGFAFGWVHLPGLWFLGLGLPPIVASLLGGVLYGLGVVVAGLVVTVVLWNLIPTTRKGTWLGVFDF